MKPIKCKSKKNSFKKLAGILLLQKTDLSFLNTFFALYFKEIIEKEEKTKLFVK